MQSDAAQEIGHARVRAESRNDLTDVFNDDHPALALFASLLQQLKSKIVLAQPCIHERDIMKPNISSCAHLQQLIEDLPRFFALARDPIEAAQT